MVAVSLSSVLLLNLLWQVSTLALVAFGLAVVFGQLRIMNMAHGEFIMIGAYSAVITSALGLPPYLQLAICVVTSGILALIIELAIIRHLYGRIFDSLLATWAVGILMREIVIEVFGRSFQNIPVPVAGSYQILGTEYPAYRVVLMLASVTFFALFYFWYKRTKVGIRIRAIVANPSLASSLGLNVALYSRAVFVYGCVMTSVAGWLIVPTARVDPLMGLDYLLRSFFALILGGLGSLSGLLYGSGIIGGVQSLISAFIDPVSGYVAILLLSIAILWRRPHGIVKPS